MTVTPDTRHLTASGAVFDPVRQRILLVHHRASGYWQFPGGVWHPRPFMVVEFRAPAKPHEGMPEHRHIDMLYVAVADSGKPLVVRAAEVHAVQWAPLHQLGDVDRLRPDIPVVAALAWQHLASLMPI